MRLRIRYYGRFAVQLGKFSEEMDVPDNLSVGELLEILKNKYPVLKNEDIEVSVNGRSARESEEINAGEVAIFPPISGG